MKDVFLISVATAALALGSAPASAASNLLTNGSFENGLTGWTMTNTGDPAATGYTVPQVITYNQSSNYPTGAFGESVPTDNNTRNPGLDAVGTHFLYFSTDVGTNSLSQSVSLTAGTSYTFGFDYYLPANGYSNLNNATLTASLAGDNFANFTLGSQAPTTWLFSSAAQTFTASQTGNFMLTFGGNGYTAKDVAIDRVFLTQTAAVPEAASWAMMIVGFGAVGAALRTSRRRTTTAFA